MITTVTLNPAIDKIIEINNMELGKVHRISKMVKTLGGKSINVARILTGLELETKALCFAGRDNLDEISNYARKDKITLEPIIVDGFTRTNVKLTEPDKGYQTTDLNEPGFAISESELEKMTQMVIEAGEKSDYVVFSGSLPSGVPIDYYKTLALALKDLTRVVIDADEKILAIGLEGAPFLIKPNIHELEAAMGTTFDTLEAVVETCQMLIEKHGITYILVSMGGDGSLLVSKEMALKADILPVKVVSTVGAGDSMLAGFIFGLLNAKGNDEGDLKTALSYGVASSSIAISTQDHLSFEKELLIKTARDVGIRKL